jgi:tRNA threonylcarbamoyl adenosine modification protein (Sua5/YciO/YrdC/YwlC family)
MSQFFEIHPLTPQRRLIRQAVQIIQNGGLIVYPTDSCYALGCSIGNKSAMERIRRIRKLDPKHHFTLVCRDLSEISTYAIVDNTAYRLLKSCSPGPYTFLLRASDEVPRRLRTAKKKTIGLRVPEHPVVQALLEELGQPLMSSTLHMPGDQFPMTDPQEMRARLEFDVDLVIDGGYSGIEPTTIVDLVSDIPDIRRQGKGEVKWRVR